jgi:hypothetical protein
MRASPERRRHGIRQKASVPEASARITGNAAEANMIDDVYGDHGFGRSTIVVCDRAKGVCKDTEDLECFPTAVYAVDLSKE